MGQSLARPVLVFVGLLLVVLGLFAAGNLLIVGLGVASLAFAGVLEVIAGRTSS